MIIKYSIITVSALFVAQILASFVFSGVGKTLGDLSKQESLLSLQNQKMIEELITLESLNTISLAASKLGLQEVRVIYLTSQTPVAAKIGQ